MPENEIFLERLRASGGTREEYLSLLPETAAVMGLSCTALQARPVEIQLMLTQTYVNHWNAGRETIQAALQNVTGLDASAERQLQADQTAQMPQQSDAEKNAGRAYCTGTAASASPATRSAAANKAHSLFPVAAPTGSRTHSAAGTPAADAGKITGTGKPNGTHPKKQCLIPSPDGVRKKQKGRFRMEEQMHTMETEEAETTSESESVESSTPMNSNLMILVGAGALAVIGIIIFVLKSGKFGKKKNSKTDDFDEEYEDDYGAVEDEDDA